MRICKICCLPAKTRAKIDAALVDGITYPRIAARFSTKSRPINKVNLCRHRKHLLPKDLVRQRPAPEPEVALNLVQRIENLVADSKAIAEAAKRGKQWIAATSALREVRCCIELLGKLSGELSSSVNFNFSTINEERVAEFLDALEKRTDLAAVRARELIVERFGLPSPVFQVNFVKPPEQEEPLLLDAAPSPNGNGHA